MPPNKVKKKKKPTDRPKSYSISIPVAESSCCFLFRYRLVYFCFRHYLSNALAFIYSSFRRTLQLHHPTGMSPVYAYCCCMGTQKKHILTTQKHTSTTRMRKFCFSLCIKYFSRYFLFSSSSLVYSLPTFRLCIRCILCTRTVCDDDTVQRICGFHYGCFTVPMFSL